MGNDRELMQGAVIVAGLAVLLYMLKEPCRPQTREIIPVDEPSAIGWAATAGEMFLT